MITLLFFSRDAMPIFYTVDRVGTLQAGVTVDLDQDYAQNRFHTAPNGPTRQELETHLSGLYPDGLSKHGKFYLLDHVQANETWAAPPHVTRMVPISPMIELIYELVRRNDFPTRPSRYASMFALETADDAIHFRSARGWQGRLFKVESASAFRADMNQLQIGASSIVALLQAKKYWEGAASAAPQWEFLLQGPIRVLQEVGLAANGAK